MAQNSNSNAATDTKNGHSNTLINTEKKTVTRTYESYKYLDQYQDLLTLKLVPVSQKFLDRLGIDLIKWARGNGHAGPIKMSGFFIERGISLTTCHRWMEKHPSFKEQYDLAKQIIGNRREEAAFWRKADAGIFLKSAANYDPEWKEIEAWRSRVAKHETETENHFTIIMDNYGSDGDTKEIKYSTPRPR